MSKLIEQLIRDGYLKTPEIIEAFQKIKREDFVLPELRSEAEANQPLSIGMGQTISQPLTVAFMFELLKPEKGQKIIDIGSGSGWTAALLAEIVGPEGKVFAIERIQELREFGENNADKYGFVKSGRIVFVTADGTKGLPGQSPFDRIHVGAAANKIPPVLLKQLSIGGRMVIPQGIDLQNVVLIERLDKKRYKQKSYPGFSFVPLIVDD